jgi:hypothetical protein
MQKSTLNAFLAFFLLSYSAWADESSIQLKEGAGKDIVVNKCTLCHSADMIQINSPFLDKKAWEGIVNKMVNIMGAPLAQEEIPVAVEYLSKNYGK